MTYLDSRFWQICLEFFTLLKFAVPLAVVAIGSIYVAFLMAKHNDKRIDMGDDYKMNNDKEIKK